jgi:adenine deaminase
MEQMLAKRILAASGEKKASLVIKHARIVNVFTAELEHADIAIEDGTIVGVGDYEGKQEIEMEGKVVCPAFIDGHIHLESSMVVPDEFERLVVPHGTQAVVTDPHEIANVAGVDGIRFMMERSDHLTLAVYFMMPSCVPSTKLDESGAVLGAKKLAPFYEKEQVLGLAELMNAYGTIHADEEILSKIKGAADRNLLVDGHAPGLSEKELNAYVTAGVKSDHECSTAEEAKEKIRRGQWIMIREGTAAKNLEALLPLFEEPYYHRCMLVTDDRHPGELIRQGHLDYIIKKAIRLGANPVHAMMMATLHPAQYFGLSGVGAIAPGYKANFLVVSDLVEFKVNQVYIEGKLAAEQGQLKSHYLSGKEKTVKPPDRVGNSFQLSKIDPKDLRMEKESDIIRVLCLTPGELTTTEYHAPWVEQEGTAPGVCIDRDIIKMAVLERHRKTGHIGLGFLKGYGLKQGAVATSIAHDSHNLIIAGTNDEDMALAGNAVRKNRGGLAIVSEGTLLGELPLPIAGLMSEEPALWVDNKLTELKKLARQLGIGEGIDPFMTLAFASLPVIPKLRLNSFGLIDVEKQEITTVCI